MIGWYTGNELSKTVMCAVAMRGHSVEPIQDFGKQIGTKSTHVFYGILRGCDGAMKLCKHHSYDYYYIDNGYFDAQYIDANKQKKMDGKFRVVKNGMHERFVGSWDGKDLPIRSILVIPPSPYSANFYDTTPEDWLESVARDFPAYDLCVQGKGAGIADHISRNDAVIAFNSLAVIEAVKQGKPVYDSHGIFKNYSDDKPHVYYNYDEVRAFYEPKQFTLEEIAGGLSPI